MCSRGGIPGECFAGTARARTCGGERGPVIQQLARCRSEGLDVARRHDAARLESPDRLGDAADVVRNRRHTGAERLEERSALVELRPVGEQRHRRLAERAFELALWEVTEAPLGHVAGLYPVAVQRLERVACNDQPRAVDRLGRGDRIAEALVWPDRSETEQRAAVV